MSTPPFPPLTVGNVALSFHRAAAAVVRRVLEGSGHEVDQVEAPHERLFALQAAGEIDVLVSAWLPASHGDYLARYQEDVEVLEPHYTPYCVWAVPPYVPAGAVSEVADLKRPDVAARMTPALDGINPGAGISRFSARMITEYGLDTAGYSFRPGTERSFIRRVERGIAEREWFVIPIWRPQYLNSAHGLRPLAEPLGLLGGTDSASPIVTRAALATMAPAARERLRAVGLGNDGVEAIDTLINVEGLTPLEAADHYLRDTGRDSR
ncbi:Substrate binding domain of ABC-type glycine betaine transport system [Streptomyces sp. ADI96-02]|uniref:glycine betaine ABC transporter substrate-binding protein n=1 Tax=Streptomyces sp. ADI96-02 TaxID=1522760 RepID=UPI000FA609B6|nr:glycine betaine ABC transporter substrate-binding protein [Streptomyces sp. ADI96-02]RPK69063.1 Substrate binding domain of ABC-type glycine betaine transport system [Streptomyces sp. ADI96-02]